MMKRHESALPIDVVPNTSPPVFKWRQVIDGINGRQVIEHQGTLPPTVEMAVVVLLDVVKQMMLENSRLAALINGK